MAEGGSAVPVPLPAPPEPGARPPGAVKSFLGGVGVGVVLVLCGVPALVSVSRGVWGSVNGHWTNDLFDLFVPGGFLAFRWTYTFAILPVVVFVLASLLSAQASLFATLFEAVFRAAASSCCLALGASMLVSSAASLLKTVHDWVLSRVVRPDSPGRRGACGHAAACALFAVFAAAVVAAPVVLVVKGYGLSVKRTDFKDVTAAANGYSLIVGALLGCGMTAAAAVWNSAKFPGYHPVLRPPRWTGAFSVGLWLVVGSAMALSVILGGPVQVHTGVSIARETPSVSLKLITYNMRYLTEEPDARDNWSARRKDFVDYLRWMTPDVFALQEGFIWPLWDVAAGLPDYNWTGKGRVDGVHSGEHTAIFWNNTKLQLMEGDSFWLSGTPLVPSKFLNDDMFDNRICTWARLKDRKSGTQFVVFTAHFGWGKNFEYNAVDLILDETEKYSHGLPVVIMGDFNTPMSDRNGWYQLMLQHANPTLKDAMYSCAGPATECQRSNCSEPLDWMPRFNCRDSRRHDQRIDHVFVSVEVNVTAFQVPQGTRPVVYRTYSDHFPTVFEATFKGLPKSTEKRMELSWSVSRRHLQGLTGSEGRV